MSDELSEIAKALQPLADLLHKIAAPLADEIGESLGVWARHYRFRLGLRMLQKTERMVIEAGFAPQAVSPRLFLPIIENASVEDDEDLQSRWAALLANAAASPASVHPSYIEILRQFTPQDATLLDKLYDVCESKRTRKVTPWVDSISYGERERRIASGENPEESFQNLIRLSLIQADYEVDTRATNVTITGQNLKLPPPKLESHYELTDFAAKFVQSCRPPRKQDA
jgi:hypothetical protein